MMIYLQHKLDASMIDLVGSELRSQNRIRTDTKRPRPGSRHPAGVILIRRLHSQRPVDGTVPKRLIHAVLDFRVDGRQQVVYHAMGAAQFTNRRI